MHLTRRGWVVLAAVVGCIVMAWSYGDRSLNALAAPLAIALLAAVIAVRRADRPAVYHRPVEAGFVGETRTVELAIDAAAPISATVVDRVDDGLETTGNVVETTLGPEGRVDYEVCLAERGDHEVGPVAVTVEDVLGLLGRRFEYEERTTALAYPRAYDLRGGSRHDLQRVADAVVEHSRAEFDYLREYERGDSLRDVHWKSTAKRPDHDLVVKEFVADEDRGSVRLAAAASADRADEMATAAASVATYLLEFGVPVGLAAPDGTEAADDGHDHRRRLMGLLARTEGGSVDERARRAADVLVRADDDGTVVVVDGTEIPFDRLSGRAGSRRAVPAVDPTGDGAGPDRSEGVP